MAEKKKKNSNESKKPGVLDIRGASRIMTRNIGRADEKEYGVGNIRQISATQVVCEVMRVESTGKGPDDYMILRAEGQGGFKNPEDFDYDIALRGAFENGADKLETGY